LALRFILEICVLVSFGYWGFAVGNSILMKIMLGIGTPLLFACIWGVFESPKASIAVHGFTRILLELTFFGLAAFALVAAEKAGLAMVSAFLVLLSRLLQYIFDQ
jgi:hypothetical protein